MKYAFKLILVFFILHSSLIIAIGQIGINTDNTNPDSSAMLDVKSNNKGVLIPRITDTQRDAINNPAQGLMVYTTNDNCLNTYNGTIWVKNCGVNYTTTTLPPQTSFDLTNWDTIPDPPNTFPSIRGGVAEVVNNIAYVGLGDLLGNFSQLFTFNPALPTGLQWDPNPIGVPFSLGGESVYLDRSTSFSLAGKVYVGTGYAEAATGDEGLLKEFCEINPGSSAVLLPSSSQPPAGFVARSGAIAFAIGNKAYVGAGSTRKRLNSGITPNYYKDFWSFDPSQPANAQWTELTNVPASLQARERAIAFSIGNKGYIGTGRNSTGLITDFWEFDPGQPINAQWNAINNVPAGFQAREGAVVFIIDNKAYIGTGANSGLLKDFWEFDPAQPVNAQWKQLPSLPNNFQARVGAVGFSINNAGYIGTGTVNGSILSKDFWKFDPLSETFIQVIDAKDQSASWLMLESINTDQQDLSLSNNILSLTNDSTTVDLSNYLDNTDIQDLSLSNNILSLTNDLTTVDLSAYLDNTDNQDLSFSNNTLSLTGDATSVDLSNYVNNWTANAGDVHRLTGNVGIGVSMPSTKLQVAGDIRINNNNIYLRDGATDFNHGLGFYGDGTVFNSTDVDGPVLYGFNGGALGSNRNGTENIALRWTSNGRIGIGTSTPNRAKVEILGFVDFSVGGHGILTNSGNTTTGNGVKSYSLYADQNIAASEFHAFSDARIKDIIRLSNSQEDLSTLMAIQITDYQHIDTIQKGSNIHKKVIAQQVAKVFPQAVNNRIREVIPDIYQPAELRDQWIYLTTNLQVGDRVKIITKSSNDIHEVTAVEEGRFQVKLPSAVRRLPSAFFVYGREVHDFHAVDYEAISMLNVSATQELAKLLDNQKRRIETLEGEVKRLETLEQQLNELKVMLEGKPNTLTDSIGDE